MATTLSSDALTTESKPALYQALRRDLAAVLEGLHDDEVAVMATAACMIHQRVEAASWTGFYRVVGPDLLRVGPYQGPLGCLEISFSQGVCGAAARTREVQLVEDVQSFPGHIACDAEARSEIVLPVVRAAKGGQDGDGRGELVAVLDLDSHQPAAFDPADREGLEAIVALLVRHL